MVKCWKILVKTLKTILHWSSFTPRILKILFLTQSFTNIFAISTNNALWFGVGATFGYFVCPQQTMFYNAPSMAPWWEVDQLSLWQSPTVSIKCANWPLNLRSVFLLGPFLQFLIPIEFCVYWDYGCRRRTHRARTNHIDRAKRLAMCNATFCTKPLRGFGTVQRLVIDVDCLLPSLLRASAAIPVEVVPQWVDCRSALAGGSTGTPLDFWVEALSVSELAHDAPPTTLATASAPSGVAGRSCDCSSSAWMRRSGCAERRRSRSSRPASASSSWECACSSRPLTERATACWQKLGRVFASSSSTSVTRVETAAFHRVALARESARSQSTSRRNQLPRTRSRARRFAGRRPLWRLTSRVLPTCLREVSHPHLLQAFIGAEHRSLADLCGVVLKY